MLWMSLGTRPEPSSGRSPSSSHAVSARLRHWAVLWLIALTFRLTVGAWAAEMTADTGTVPQVYPALARWAGLGHGVHMVAAYVSAVPLAIVTARAGLIPDWLGIIGIVWGLGLALLFLIPRTRFVAAPPFWAHVFTCTMGVALLT